MNSILKLVLYWSYHKEFNRHLLERNPLEWQSCYEVLRPKHLPGIAVRACQVVVTIYYGVFLVSTLEEYPITFDMDNTSLALFFDYFNIKVL